MLRVELYTRIPSSDFVPELAPASARLSKHMVKIIG